MKHTIERLTVVTIRACTVDGGVRQFLGIVDAPIVVADTKHHHPRRRRPNVWVTKEYHAPPPRRRRGPKR